MLLCVAATYLGSQPAFIMRPRSETVVESSSVTFYCGANGRDRNEQQAKISWLKDGVTLDTRLVMVMGVRQLLYTKILALCNM